MESMADALKEPHPGWKPKIPATGTPLGYFLLGLLGSSAAAFLLLRDRKKRERQRVREAWLEALDFGGD